MPRYVGTGVFHGYEPLDVMDRLSPAFGDIRGAIEHEGVRRKGLRAAQLKELSEATLDVTGLLDKLPAEAIAARAILTREAAEQVGIGSGLAAMPEGAGTMDIFGNRTNPIAAATLMQAQQRKRAALGPSGSFRETLGRMAAGGGAPPGAAGELAAQARRLGLASTPEFEAPEAIREAVASEYLRGNTKFLEDAVRQREGERAKAAFRPVHEMRDPLRLEAVRRYQKTQTNLNELRKAQGDDLIDSRRAVRQKQIDALGQDIVAQQAGLRAMALDAQRRGDTTLHDYLMGELSYQAPAEIGPIEASALETARQFGFSPEKGRMAVMRAREVDPALFQRADSGDAAAMQSASEAVDRYAEAITSGTFMETAYPGKYGPGMLDPAFSLVQRVQRSQPQPIPADLGEATRSGGYQRAAPTPAPAAPPVSRFTGQPTTDPQQTPDAYPPFGQRLGAGLEAAFGPVYKPVGGMLGALFHEATPGGAMTDEMRAQSTENLQQLANSQWPGIRNIAIEILEERGAPRQPVRSRQTTISPEMRIPR